MFIRLVCVLRCALHAEARGGSDLTVAVFLSLGMFFSLGAYQKDYDACAFVSV